MTRKYCFTLPDEMGKPKQPVSILADSPADAIRILKNRGLHPLELISVDGKDVGAKKNKGLLAGLLSFFATRKKKR